jgi:hypothetical protein
MIRCTCHFKEKTFKICVGQTCTIGGLMHKLRNYIQLNEAEAMFLFIDNKFYSNSKFLSDLGNILTITIRTESTYGSMDRQFIKASIVTQKGLFICRCVWSWYGLYEYEDVSIHNSDEEAKSYLIKLRCGDISNG